MKKTFEMPGISVRNFNLIVTQDTSAVLQAKDALNNYQVGNEKLTEVVALLEVE